MISDNLRLKEAIRDLRLRTYSSCYSYLLPIREKTYNPFYLSNIHDILPVY